MKADVSERRREAIFVAMLAERKYMICSVVRSSVGSTMKHLG